MPGDHHGRRVPRGRASVLDILFVAATIGVFALLGRLGRALEAL
ncbi:hypothetical protein CZ771_06765 [Actinomycetales bacterium JB111]|nr:hypothetical protein CZ771_06765 [Actinomycetales bacterium JB111]